MNITLGAVEAAERAEVGKRIKQTPLERWTFAAFLFTLPFQTRFLLHNFGVGAASGEWMSVWVWFSDLAFLAMFVLWINRGIAVKDCIPLLILVAALPALIAHHTLFAMWTVLKLAEGIFLFSYIRRHRGWLLTTLLWPSAFLIGLAVQAVVATGQFTLQHDLGLRILDESPLRPDLLGVAKIIVGGAKVVRAYGITPHPNVLAAMLLAGIAVVTFLYLFRGVRRIAAYSGRRQREELLRGAGFFLFLLALLVTFSRTGWLSMAIFIFAVVATILLRKSLRGPYLWETARFAVLFAAVALMAMVAFWPYLTARSELSLAEEAISLRTFTANEAVAMISEHPLTGVGPGQFTQELVNRNPTLPAWEIQPVHNVVLLLAAEYGIPAMAVFIIAFVFLVLATWRRVVSMHDPVVQLASLCLLAFVTGVLFFSLGDHFLLTSQQGRLMLWFTLGLLAP